MLVHTQPQGFEGDARWIASIQLDEVGGALATCDPVGRLTGCSPSAQDLLRRLGVRADLPLVQLPADLWRLLSARDVGVAVQWRASNADHLLLGCSRYAL